jgi:hypothetical protein
LNLGRCRGTFGELPMSTRRLRSHRGGHDSVATGLSEPTNPRAVFRPFGFDVEWKPNFVKGQPQSPIALLQLAKEDQILLIQLSAMNGE